MATKQAAKAKSEDETTEAVDGVEEEGHTPAPHPDTFDFGEFLEDKLEYPRFKATVYADAAAAVSITELLDEKRTLERQLTAARSRAKQDEKSVGSLTGNSASTEVVELEDKLSGLEERHRELDEKFQRSRLEFIFQHTEKPTAVESRVDAEVKNHYPDLPQAGTTAAAKVENHPGYNYRFRLFVLELLRDLRDHEGRSAANLPTYDQLVQLLEYLPQSESNKLANAITMAITGGNATQRAVDAGFPG